MPELDDWVRAPNIADNVDLYERENEALAADGRLDEALRGVADWSDRVLVDIGCGTGFWLPRYATDAAAVIGVEPDPELLAAAAARTGGLDNVQVIRGSAEHLPVASGTVDIAHARFAYFFGEGADAGLEEVARVLRPGGVLVAVDNDWGHGEFADLLRDATGGNADIDPAATDRWWRARGADRVEVHGAWRCRSPEELEAILRIEFPEATVDRYLERHAGRSAIEYGFALFVWRSPSMGGATVADSWPAWATEKVEIVEWDPSWEPRAGQLISDLGQRLEPWLAGPVEHVGSTAVPNLAAKPVLDLLAPVRSLREVPEADDVLAEAGWELVPPELDQRPWRRMYVLPERERRLAHLHLVEGEHPRVGEILRFRDRLRRHPELAREYAQVKRLAARDHPDDREAYTSAKSAFVREVVARP